VITVVDPRLPYGFAKTHGVLLLAAGEVMAVGVREGADPLALVEARDFSDADARDAMAAARTSEGGAADPRLRALLKDLRKEVADEEELPPYVIFQDVSLDEMATHYPICEDELLRITGVGTGKAKKFGAPFL
jgi:ATP-dependent DNA helicase RecQ